MTLRELLLPLVALGCPTEAIDLPTAAWHSSNSLLAYRAASVRIGGEYRYIGGEKEEQDLFDAIEDTIADMSFIARPIARKRLRESNLPSPELHLVFKSKSITIARPGRPSVSAPRDGSTIVWKSPDGDEFHVQHRLVDEDQLVQEFVGDGNRSENVFRLSKDGSRVTVHTTITADRLPKALRFQTTYQRKPPPADESTER